MNDNVMKSDDILFQCAKSYKKLIGTEFTFELGDKYERFTLNFDVSQFMHLTSIEKLNDLWEIENISSKELFEMILKRELTYDRLEQSTNFNENVFPAKSPDGKANGVEYGIKDRLISLTDLFDNLNNINNTKGTPNIDVYMWNAEPFKQSIRPYNSKIMANYLVEFMDTPHKKVSDERTCLFLKKEGLGESCIADSIFPSDVTLSDDGKRRVEQYKVLSVSKCRANDKDNVTYLIQGDETEIEKAKQKLSAKESKNEMNNKMAQLKRARAKYISGKDRNSTYKKILNEFQDKELFKTDLDATRFLNEVILRLKTSLNDTNNEEVKECIEQEIKCFEETLEKRREQPYIQKKTSFSVNETITNPDGTTIINPIKTVAIPNVINDLRIAAKRAMYKLRTGMRSLVFKISDKVQSTVSPSEFSKKASKQPQKKITTKSHQSSKATPKQAKQLQKNKTQEQIVVKPHRIKAVTLDTKSLTPKNGTHPAKENKLSVFAEIEAIKAQQKEQSQHSDKAPPNKTKTKNNNIDL